jgi:hypothetical protein
MPQLPGAHPEIPADCLQLDLFNQLCQAFTQGEEVRVVTPDDMQCIAEVHCWFAKSLVLLHGVIPGE